MALHCCTGAMMKCAMGLAPSTFNATPKMVMTGNMPAGNIMDFVPMLNIPPFGMCMSPSNPTVAAATGACDGNTLVLCAAGRTYRYTCEMRNGFSRCETGRGCVN